MRILSKDSSLPRNNKKANENTKLNPYPKGKQGLKAQKSKPKPKVFPYNRDLGNWHRQTPSHTPEAIIDRQNQHQNGTEPPSRTAPKRRPRRRPKITKIWSWNDAWRTYAVPPTKKLARHNQRTTTQVGLHQSTTSLSVKQPLQQQRRS